MDDLISRKALLEQLEPEYMRKARMVENGEYHLDTLAEGFTSAHSLIENAPAVEAEPVKHGNWIDDFKCSNCNKMFLAGVRHWNYCPNCGAKMEVANGCA